MEEDTKSMKRAIYRTFGQTDCTVNGYNWVADPPALGLRGAKGIFDDVATFFHSESILCYLAFHLIFGLLTSSGARRLPGGLRRCRQ